MVIDFHTHVFPDKVAAQALATLRRRAGIAPVFDGTADGLRSVMARAGVAKSVVLPVASKASQVHSINDWAAGLADRQLVPFGAMHPDLPDPDSELERLRELGLLGIKLHPEYQSFRPDEERLVPLFAAAAEQRIIVFFHARRDLASPCVHSDPRPLSAYSTSFPSSP